MKRVEIFTEVKWQKSSFSEGNGPQCIELGCPEGNISLRESDAPDVIVTTNRAALQALFLGIKTGHIVNPS